MKGFKHVIGDGRFSAGTAFTPRYGICPMASGATEEFNLSDKEVARWCAAGCSPECGSLLIEKMGRKERKACNNCE